MIIKRSRGHGGLKSLKQTITCLNQYGHNLLERYDEACDIFAKGLGFNQISKKALIGYARALSFLLEPDMKEASINGSDIIVKRIIFRILGRRSF